MITNLNEFRKKLNEELSVGPHGLEEENEWVVFRVDTAGFDYYILPADTVEDHSEYRHRDMFFGDEGVEYFDTHELAQAAVNQYEVDDFDADDDEESGEFEVEVSVRDAQKAIDIFNSGYRNLGIPSASNAFSFPLKSTYLDFINDLQQLNIEIISEINETLDPNVIYIFKAYCPPPDSSANRGKVIQMPNNVIVDYLKNPEDWTDDEYFIDIHKNRYHIDDLIGKQVKVGDVSILVTENFNDNHDLINPLKTSIKMVIMSHLSDVQETHSGDKDLNNRINFAKSLLMKINDKTEIDPEAEWEAFTKTRFYRA